MPWFRAFVGPRLGRIAARFRIPAGEEPLEFFRVAELLRNDRGGVGVRHDVLAKLEAIREHVIDEGAEKNDIRPGANR